MEASITRHFSEFKVLTAKADIKSVISRKYYDGMLDIISKTGGLLGGGTAVDMHMKTLYKESIYGSDDVPDIDFVTSVSRGKLVENMCYALSDTFELAGMNNVFKIKFEGQSIIDMSTVPDEVYEGFLYEEIPYGVDGTKKIRCVPMHQLISAYLSMMANYNMISEYHHFIKSFKKLKQLGDILMKHDALPKPIKIGKTLPPVDGKVLSKLIHRWGVSVESERDMALTGDYTMSLYGDVGIDTYDVIIFKGYSEVVEAFNSVGFVLHPKIFESYLPTSLGYVLAEKGKDKVRLMDGTSIICNIIPSSPSVSILNMATTVEKYAPIILSTMMQYGLKCMPHFFTGETKGRMLSSTLIRNVANRTGQTIYEYDSIEEFMDEMARLLKALPSDEVMG